ncbi:hypothetical protein BJY04DRAFT_190645 [Aspergillus karnatakaensis]|uniref:uncharacterized protein n=1 Tax=Aspergillus karnatakaensis TaxID=1810916 RepID=UPI003CCCFFBA
MHIQRRHAMEAIGRQNAQRPPVLPMAEDRLDLLPFHEITIIEDPAKYNGATPHDIRDHFKLWSQDELTRILIDPTKRTGFCYGPGGAKPYPIEQVLGPRFNHCLFVDEICLEFLDHEPDNPVVKIVARSWEQPEPETDPNPEPTPDWDIYPGVEWEDGQTDSVDEDVGWMYVEVMNYCDWYRQFVDFHSWQDWYKRPPVVPDFLTFWKEPDRLPGYWRKNKKRDA